MPKVYILSPNTISVDLGESYMERHKSRITNPKARCVNNKLVSIRLNLVPFVTRYGDALWTIEVVEQRAPNQRFIGTTLWDLWFVICDGSCNSPLSPSYLMMSFFRMFSYIWKMPCFSAYVENSGGIRMGFFVASIISLSSIIKQQ